MEDATYLQLFQCSNLKKTYLKMFNENRHCSAVQNDCRPLLFTGKKRQYLRHMQSGGFVFFFKFAMIDFFLHISFHSVVQIFFTMMPSFLKLFKNDTKMAIWYDHDQMFFSAIEMYTALSWSVLLGHKSIGTYP